MRKFEVHKSNLSVFGYTNGFAYYGKNTSKKYVIEVKMFYFDEVIKLYSGNKKPLFKNLFVISLIMFPIVIIVTILAIVYSLIYVYFDGARNFFYNGAWVNNVREFNIVNIFLIITLTILLILK